MARGARSAGALEDWSLLVALKYPHNISQLQSLNAEIREKRKAWACLACPESLLDNIGVVKDIPIKSCRLILTLPRGNAKLPPQASPAHSGTCQHEVLCHTQVLHECGCAYMEAPLNELIWPMFSYHHSAHILPQIPVPLWGFPTAWSTS